MFGGGGAARSLIVAFVALACLWAPPAGAQGPPPASITASPQDDTIQAHGFDAGASLTFTIRDGPAPGGSQLFSGSRQADPGGNAFLNQFEHGVNLIPGYEVEVSGNVAGAATTRILLIENLALTSVDRATGIVSGTADPSEPSINVNVFKQSCGNSKTVAADGTGNWSADFSLELCAVDVQARVAASIADGDGDATAVNIGPMNIGAGLTHDNISLNGFNPSANVSLEIRNGPTILFGPQNVTANAQGNAFVDRSVHNVDIVPGLTIEATQGSTTKTLTTANLAITSVDAGNDDVGGTAPSGAQVGVGVNNPGPCCGSFQQVTADGSGNWTADFSNPPNQFDITGGTHANAQVSDADGDMTFVDKQPATLSASLTGDQINMNGWGPGSNVSLEIRNGPTTLFGPQNVTANAQGNAFVDRSVHNVDIVPGLTIEATQGTTTKTLTTVNLSITDVNAASDAVTGTAPSGAQVGVNVNDPGPCCSGGFQQVTPDGSGNWVADFSNPPNQFDITGGTNAHAQVNDADNDATYVDRQPAQISANLSFDNIDGQGFAQNSSVDIEVRSGPGVEPPVHTGTAPTDGGGNFFVGLEETLDLVPGNEVTVTDGATTKVLVLADLAITSVDEGNDDVIGTAPASAEVEVNVNDQEAGASQQVAADGSGNWTADFSNPPNQYDITAGTGADAAVRDADGDATRFGKEPPGFGVEPQQNQIFGDWAPNSSVTVEIRSAPGVEPPIFSTTSPTDETGFFNVDTNGSPDVVPGQEVTVTDGVDTKVHVVIDVAIIGIDPTADQVTGTAPAGTPLNVQVDEAAHRELTVGGSGNWTADFGTPPAYDIDSQSLARATASDDDGDNTAVEKRPATIGAELDFDGIHGQGFLPDDLVSVQIRSAEGVNPPLFSDNVLTDGNGEFNMGPFDHNVDLVPGMAITVSDGPSTKLLVLAQLTVDPIDPATDVVSGTTNPGAQVDLRVDGRNGQAEASETGGSPQGNWSHDFTGELNIVGGDFISPSVADADGDYTGLDERRAAAVNASLTDDDVCPEGFSSSPTVTIRDAGGTRLWRGDLPRNLSGCIGPGLHGQDLVPGMIVEATDGTIAKDLSLAAVAITSVDAATDTVMGTAPADALVLLSLHGPFDLVGEVTADGSGNWTGDLSAPGFSPQEAVFAQVPDDEGDRTVTHRYPPNIRGNLTLDIVSGCGFAPGDFVTVTIDGLPDPVVPTAGNGCFEFEAPGDLVPGTAVSVTDGALTRSLALAPLTMDVDIAGGQITGTASPGAEVQVGFSVVDQEKGDGMTVTADGSGNWVADFGDLEPGVDITANVGDADGDLTEVSWRADLRLSAANYTVPEAAGSIDITVERIGTAHVTVGVSHATADGTATAGQDYDETSGALSFPDGVTSQTYTVPITDDTDNEDDETLTVALSDPTGGAEIDTPAAATITIEDDDGGPAILDLSSATYSIGEKGGKATITVERTGNLGNSGGVSFAVPDPAAPGNATANSDYTATSGTLSFGPGDTSKTFDVQIRDDSIFEPGGSESVGLKILNPTGGAALGSRVTGTLNIVEDDPQPRFQFAQPTYSVAENVGSLSVVVTRIGAPGNAGTVQYQVAGGSAGNGSDYTLSTPGTLSFGANTSSRTITVPITNDTSSEPAENIVISLVGPSSPFGIGSPNPTFVTIAASDQRPDVLVGPNPGSGFIGANVYEPPAPPSNQQITIGAFRGGPPAVFFFRIENDGQTVNTFFIGGPPAPAKTTLQYFNHADNSNITGLVQTGSYQVTRPPFGSILIRAELAISTKARQGQSFAIPLTATWRSPPGDAVMQDTARAVVFAQN